MPFALLAATVLAASVGSADLGRVEDLPGRFQAAQGEARLVLVVSPTSTSCMRALRLIERDVLRELAGKPIRTYVVWTPMVFDDSREAALKEAQRSDSIYVEQFWDPTRRTARAYGKLVELPNNREMAWNAYFIHSRSASWNLAPPVPDDWMHQLGSDPRRLTAEAFRDKVRAVLGDSL